MNEKKKYVHCDENGNITILTEEDLPKCPITNEISPKVWIIGSKKPTPEIEPINCRCSVHLIGDNDDW